ncbi:hypothetical protein BAY61_06570 [Prauserella marina]|nr:hypothetical protein BAY61_06570 [Prauserella marina]
MNLGCAYFTMTVDVAKLEGDIVFGDVEPGFLRADYGRARGNQPCDAGVDQFGDYTCSGAIVTESRLAVDPLVATPTVVADGIGTVEAILELTMAEPVFAALSRIEQRLYTDNFRRFPLFFETGASMSVRLADVRVNGASYDVGPNCRTQEPIDTVLYGSSGQAMPEQPGEYSLAYGGTLTGSATIPPFTGCGPNGSLDSLITQAVSGPGNAIEVRQGGVCFEAGEAGCPPALPET